MAAISDKRVQNPKDVNSIKNLLKELGINEYEPAVVNLVMDFAYKYVTDTLEDAKIYSQHAQKRNIDIDDVKLILQHKIDHEMRQPPSAGVLEEIAATKNMNSLPPIKHYAGLKLPPDRYCLLAPNYQLKNFGKINTSLATNNINIHNLGTLRQPYMNNSIPGSFSQNMSYLSRPPSLQHRLLLPTQTPRGSINIQSFNTTNVTHNPRLNLLMKQNPQLLHNQIALGTNPSINNTNINKNNL